MRYVYLVLLLILPFVGKAQTGTYTDPYFFETGPGMIFNIPSGQNNNYPIGADSACLNSTDNATFIYTKLCSPGDMDVYLANGSSSSIDMSYVVFGPLTSPFDTSQFLNSNVVSCNSMGYLNYQFNIPAGQLGDYFMIVITNESAFPGTITIGQNGGTGISDSSCISILNCSHPSFSQPICEVTTDTSNQYWTIVFERETTYGQLTYQIQRESTVQGQYLTIGTVAPGDSSVFTDNSVFAQQQAQRYRINTIDSCGNQRLGAYHQTMHLVTSSGVNNLNQLIWTPYTGFSYGTYFIYRGTNMNNMVLIDSISASYTSYTDMNSPVGLSYYQVSVVPPSPCVATRSLSFAKSNVATKQYLHVGVGESVFASLQVYPNPSSGSLQLNFNQNFTLEIFDVSGRLLRSMPCYSGNTVIDLSELNNGLYLLRFNTTEGSTVRNLLIQH